MGIRQLVRRATSRKTHLTNTCERRETGAYGQIRSDLSCQVAKCATCKVARLYDSIAITTRARRDWKQQFVAVWASLDQQRSSLNRASYPYRMMHASGETTAQRTRDRCTPSRTPSRGLKEVADFRKRFAHVIVLPYTACWWRTCRWRIT